jgi:hypothetical protein
VAQQARTMHSHGLQQGSNITREALKQAPQQPDGSNHLKSSERSYTSSRLVLSFLFVLKWKITWPCRFRRKLL